jgi:hypothetical protein
MHRGKHLVRSLLPLQQRDKDMNRAPNETCTCNTVQSPAKVGAVPTSGNEDDEDNMMGAPEDGAKDATMADNTDENARLEPSTPMATALPSERAASHNVSAPMLQDAITDQELDRNTAILSRHDQAAAALGSDGDGETTMGRALPPAKDTETEIVGGGGGGSAASKTVLGNLMSSEDEVAKPEFMRGAVIPP